MMGLQTFRFHQYSIDIMFSVRPVEIILIIPPSPKKKTAFHVSNFKKKPVMIMCKRVNVICNCINLAFRTYDIYILQYSRVVGI